MGFYFAILLRGTFGQIELFYIFSILDAQSHFQGISLIYFAAEGLEILS